jgi:hypothetical protein
MSAWPSELFEVETPTAPIQMSPYDARQIDTMLKAARSSAAERDPDWSALLPGSYPTNLLTVNGRTALALALAEIAPGKDDEILVVTTTGSPYISGCVTREIEKLCRWARKPSPATRAVLVIHEFGYPAALPAGLDPKLPVIEDCAWAFGVDRPDLQVGARGDFVIYSLPKALPMPFGGLLRAKRPLARAGNAPLLSDAALRMVRGGVQLHGAELAAAVRARLDNYRRYEALFAKSGHLPYFDLEPGMVPHAFVFKLQDEARGKRVKLAMEAANIDCSVFFGAGGFYLPNHQNLDAAAIDYLHARFLHTWKHGA